MTLQAITADVELGQTPHTYADLLSLLGTRYHCTQVYRYTVAPSPGYKVPLPVHCWTDQAGRSPNFVLANNSRLRAIDPVGRQQSRDS